MSYDELEMHLLMFFSRKERLSPQRVIEELELLERLWQGESTIQEAMQLQHKIGSLLTTIHNRGQNPELKEGTNWTPLNKWKHGTSVVHEFEVPRRMVVEIDGLLFEGSKLGGKNKTLVRWSGNPEDHALSVTTIPDSLCDYLFMRFIELLDNLPLTAIRRCPECGSYFVHFSKRMRTNCSNKCSARRGARNRREKMKAENPEAYQEELKRSAGRARKSYEKRIDRGKPARRPYKHIIEEEK